jgi:CHAD domain-containing protein
LAKAPRYGNIRADASVRTLADAVLCALWDAMLAESDGAAAGEDPEAVHDMRVAMRRLRSALRVFGDCYPRKALRRLSKRTRRLGRRLGTVRDADVQLAVLRTALASAADAERDGIAFAMERLGERRGVALSEFGTQFADFDRASLDRMLADG